MEGAASAPAIIEVRMSFFIAIFLFQILGSMYFDINTAGNSADAEQLQKPTALARSAFAYAHILNEQVSQFEP